LVPTSNGLGYTIVSAYGRFRVFGNASFPGSWSRSDGDLVTGMDSASRPNETELSDTSTTGSVGRYSGLQQPLWGAAVSEQSSFGDGVKCAGEPRQRLCRVCASAGRHRDSVGSDLGSSERACGLALGHQNVCTAGHRVEPWRSNHGV